MRSKTRAHIGLALGLLCGAIVYGVFRVIAPAQLGFATAAIGIGTGLGARLGRSFGTPRQLRVIVFGTLLTFVGVEALVYLQKNHDAESFALYLLQDPTWLVFSLIFLVCGIVFGVRLLVGNDPLSDVLLHGAQSTSGSGTQCPACNSHRTEYDSHSGSLSCTACGHEWRALTL